MMLHSTVWFSIIILFIHITLVHTTNPTYAPTINPYGSICMQSIHAHCHEALNSFNLTAISYCVETHTSAIEPHCIAVLNKNILSVGDACKWDLVTYCAQQILHPFRSIVCLMEHFDVLSSTCRFEVELAIAPIIPCGKEVSNYCKEKVTIEEAVTCLEEQPVTDLDPLHCLPALQHYDTCKKEPATACILPPPPLPNHPTNTGNQGKSSNDNDNKKQDSPNHKKNKKHKRRHKKKHSSSDTSSSTTSTTARPPQHHALAIIFFILIVVLILVGMVYKGNNNSFKDLNYQRVNSILTTQWRAIIDWVHICMTGDQSAPKDAQRASTAISDDSSHLTTNPFHAPTSTTERSHFIPQTEYHEGKRYSIASGVDDDVENMKDDEEVSIELSHIVHNSPAKQSSSPTSPHKSPSTS